MAKQLKWGSFGIEDLRVDEEDDIYKGFPFLKLEGFEMILKTLLTITMNLVRGIYGTDDTKITGLSGSLPYGWDRTSLPIPFIFNATQGILEIFDRRHTLNVLNSINSIDEVPGARYSRIFPDGYDLINSFSTKSILTMAGVWGNVFGPIKDDAKDHHFVAAALDIFKREDITPERDHVYEVIKWMGVNERYNFNKSVVSRIVTDIMSEYDDPNTVANKVSYDTDKNSIDSFIAESKEWQPNDTVTDTTVYIVKAIEDNSGFLAKYADDITRKICEVEKEYGQEKLIKVLLYNQTNKQSKKIAKARKVFREKITTQWELRRNNVLKPIESILNPEIITKKKLSDFNLEIWFKDQIEGEDAPFQMRLD